MKKSSLITLSILITTLAACGGNGAFTGSNKSASPTEPAAQDNQSGTTTTTTQPDDNTAATTVTTTTVASDTKTIPAVCTATLNYNPTDIQCSLKESASNTLWKHSGPSWSTLVSNFVNKDASWLSPLASAKSAGTNYDLCPNVPGSDRLIYVSHFELAADTTVKLEAIIDDKGSVRLWKDADSKNVAYASTEGPSANGEVALTKGSYSVIIDGIDTGAVATGMIASFTDKTSGAMIRQTEATKDWCIYRVTQATNVEDFINSAALCQPCMRGDAAN